ncbi:PREDICTED: growth/differentiation factor 11-like [Crocodylus porosus]|uniref:growth/differentiation factor 11-like n=1 Tax=Crocodylus porosus TaxID=8502 RepID=UPI00093D0EF3|nr:PREDICTED: growth/differentiation factor 11-like [Crocodylus porosus]
MSAPRAPALLCLLVLSVELSRGEPEPQPPAQPEAEPACPVCLWRKHSKELRLESIKSQILSKLRLKEAPNITREVVNQLLPKAPPLQQLLDLHDFQGDAFPHEDYVEEDEYHATTETVISMAQRSKHSTAFVAAPRGIVSPGRAGPGPRGAGGRGRGGARPL